MLESKLFAHTHDIDFLYMFSYFIRPDLDRLFSIHTKQNDRAANEKQVSRASIQSVLQADVLEAGKPDQCIYRT